MSFASPLWLLALVPWAALVVWLLLGRRQRVRVPFLALWPRLSPDEQPRRGLRAPPFGLLLALLATLLAILAAAGPLVGLPGYQRRQPLSLLIDRGITMSAGGRFRDLARAAAGPIALTFGPLAPVEIVPIPGDHPIATTADRCARLIADLPATAIPTRQALLAAAQRELARSTGPVLVLTDQPLGLEDPRLTLIAPSEPLQNVGIARLAARSAPSPQLMVRLRNDSSRQNATLRVTADQQASSRLVELPPRGEERNYFVEIPADAGRITIAVEPGDELAADDAASLILQRTWPRIQAAAPLPEEVDRIVAVYSRQRPAADDARAVLIVRSAQELPPGQRGILLAPGSTTRPAASIQVTPHPITTDIDWPQAVSQASLAADPPEGWLSLVRAGDKTVLAAREQPARQVWVGLHSDAWPRQADFVVFWTKLLDWTGEGGETYAAQTVGQIPSHWRPVSLLAGPQPVAPGQWPGIYQADDGLRAVNAPAAAVVPPPPGNWRDRLAAQQARGGSGWPAAPWLAVAALAALVVAALTWRIDYRPVESR